MANKTIKDAKTIHGTNPQHLIEKIIRTRIYESRYWKEECFALTADLVVDKGAELRYIGGIYGGNIKPSPFLCLTLKLLQIQPEKDIIIEFIRQESFKYIRALGAFYLRLVCNSLDIYKYLEPLYNDYRKLRRMDKMGNFDIIYMDEFVDSLLRDDRVFDTILPRLTKRFVHEENGELTKRISLINEDLILEEDDDKNEDNKSESSEFSDPEVQKRRRSRSPSRRDDRDRRRDSESPHSRKHRDRRSRSHSPSRKHREHRHKKHRDHKKKSKKDEKDDGGGETSKEKAEADEIAEMNALRAKLGLKPLRP